MVSRLADRVQAVACLALILLAAGPAFAALRVVATFPDLADMARQIGGDRLDVETLADGSSDPHRVPMRPSFVTKLHRADALIVMGLGMEHAFLPGLLEVARNAAIEPGAPAFIDASLYVTALEVPTSLDRSQGDLHPLGNPHFNLDPVRGREMARAIAEGLARVDPAGTSVYQAGLARFRAALDRRIAEWERLAQPLRGVKIVSYHGDLVYLAERYGLVLAGTIETKPGVAATASHVEALVTRMNAEGVRVIVREIAYEPRLAETIAARTGARVVPLSIFAGGRSDTNGYLDFIESNLRALLAAVVPESTSTR